MNKKDLAAAAARKTGMTKKDAEKAADALFSALAEALANGEKVGIAGFGIFETRERAARIGHLPGSDEAVEIPSSVSVAFRPSKQLKEKLNQS